jgi:hypothetical protein
LFAPVLVDVLSQRMVKKIYLTFVCPCFGWRFIPTSSVWYYEIARCLTKSLCHTPTCGLALLLSSWTLHAMSTPDNPCTAIRWNPAPLSIYFFAFISHIKRFPTCPTSLPLSLSMLGFVFAFAGIQIRLGKYEWSASNLVLDCTPMFYLNSHSFWFLTFTVWCSNLSSCMCCLYLKQFKALFTSKVFEGMVGDYSVSRNFPDRLFTNPGFEGIIPGYPHKSPPL